MKKENIILIVSLISPLLIIGFIFTYMFQTPLPFDEEEYIKSLYYNGKVQNIYKKHEIKGQKLMIQINDQTFYLPYKEANKFIEKEDSIVKNKGETSLHIYRNNTLVNSLKFK